MSIPAAHGEIPGVPQYGPAGHAAAVPAIDVPGAAHLSSAAAPAVILDGRGRVRVFWVEVGYLLILLGAASAYFVAPSVSDRVPKSFGPVPIAVPWFGAVGAVTIGLQGVFQHSHDWDSGYNLWHIARPLIGIVLAVVAYLIFIAGILATGTGSVATGAARSSTGNILYYLIAFVVGYREEVFRSLLQRLADVVLTPGGSGTSPRPQP